MSMPAKAATLLLTTVMFCQPVFCQTAMLEGTAASYRDLNKAEPPPMPQAPAAITKAQPAISVPNTMPLVAPPAHLSGTALQKQASPNHTYVHVRPQENRNVYVKDNRTFWQRHPMVKGVAIGSGAGAGAGALTGLISHQGILRGAAIGAGTGAGVGVLRTSQIMKRHPIARDVATGAASGLGVGWAGSRRPGIALAGTGIGSAIGLGTGLFTQLR